jgi:hypothetical protein
MTKEFKTTITAGERGRVSVFVPFDPKEIWGKQTRFHVDVVVNRITFHTSLGVRDGKYFFPFNKDMQEQTGLQAGDAVTVRLSLTKAEDGNDELPEDLQKALAKNKKAAAFFGTLSSFYKNTYVKWITSAKQEETRNKRVAETVRLLAEGKKQK